jgi:uncharacterized protein with HEPN domain
MKKKSRRELIVFPSSMLSPKARAVREYMRKHPLPVPPTVRQCAVQGLSSYGFPPSRTSMSPAHTRELVERYPELYRHADDKPVSSCEPFAREGFACGDGWFTIIDRLSAKLTGDPNLVVSQLKEKIGLLKVYFNATELASTEIEAATDVALHRACRDSKRTCEICGAPGAYKKRGRHVGVLCKPCEWLDEIEEACRRLIDCAEGIDLPGFAAHRTPLEAAKRHIQHIGEAASHQSTERRTWLPGIDWKRLDTFRVMTGVSGAPAMRAVEIWTFILEEVPTLVKALQ